jgi:hypothetical protein
VGDDAEAGLSALSPPTMPPLPMCRLGSCGSRTGSPIRPLGKRGAASRRLAVSRHRLCGAHNPAIVDGRGYAVDGSTASVGKALAGIGV